MTAKKGTTLALGSAMLFATVHIGAESSTTDPFKFIYPSTLGTGGYIIDEPGYYVLVEDIAFDAAGTAYAINITTSHVTLNLNDHSITQNNSSVGVSGIVINPGLGDITIKDGTLSGFTRYGLISEATNSDGIFNITVENLDITNATCVRAIYIKGTDETQVAHDITFSNCTVTNCTCLLGGHVNFDYCKNIKCSNCSFNNNMGAANNIALVTNSTTCDFIECHFDNNQSFTDGSDVHILYLNGSHACTVDSCSFNSNSFEDPDQGNRLFIINANQCDGTNIKNCQLTNNQAYSQIQAIRILGQSGTNDRRGSTIDNCIIQNIKSRDYNAWGIHVNLDQEACIISNCTVQDITATSGNAYGIDLADGDRCIVENSTVLKCEGVSGSDGIGINIGANAVDSTISNCRTFNNSTYGIFNDNPGTAVVGCISGQNTTANYAGNTPAETPIYKEVEKLGSHYDAQEFENISLVAGGSTGCECCSEIYLTAANFSSGTYTISTPGYYILCEDINFTALANVRALVITTNYVTVDLNGHAIYNTGNGTDGIYASNVQGITIKNGTISGFTSNGIEFDTVTSYEILNCTIMNSTSDGINLNSCTDGRIVDCNSIQNNSSGLETLSANKLYVKNSHFDDNDTAGCFLDNTFCVIFEDCTFNNNSGFGISQIFTGILRNCIAAGNTGTGFYTASNVIFESCTAFENTVHGFIVGNGVQMIQCKSNKNGDSGINCIGNTVITNCSCFDNTLYGIYNTSANTIITGCVAGNNTTANYGGTFYPVVPALVNMPRLGSNVAVNNIFANIAIPS